jgi:3',5'-cyclic-AMP phosphodiesterase
MRLAWTTDIHLNFLDDAMAIEFFDSFPGVCDAVVVTGDIGESMNVIDHLKAMERALRCPIYFVLGNHDFYRGSIRRVREAVTRLASYSDYLTYLTASEAIALTPRTAILGHDGWSDGQLGDFGNSTVRLNDYYLIDELRCHNERGEINWARLHEVLAELGRDAAARMEVVLSRAAASYPRLIAATHVPPFREAAWYAGRISDDNYLPHFSCGAMGQAIMRVMNSHPNANLRVLCGHTHGSGHSQVAGNVSVSTGGAEYGKPMIQEILEVE